ncbi:Nuclear protein export factor [Pseudomonas syringae pv. actinidiae]|uniref:Nuclear protein export factor n=1 Tax=Pseudomonas syringae pv. actinidiae TaxID=103796 RepID=A0AAN4TJP9_PSESF|nr:Nuclear protein export factor [Pseudomonas syringae pv. actinidiae]
MHSGQISHGRLVWESVWESLVRRHGVRRLAGKSPLLKVITEKTVTKFLQLIRRLPTRKKAPITAMLFT